MLERHQLRRGGTWGVFKLQNLSSLIVSDSDYCATFYPFLFLLFVFYILTTLSLLLILLFISDWFFSLPRRVGSSVFLSVFFFRFTCTSVFAVRWHTQESPELSLSWILKWFFWRLATFPIVERSPERYGFVLSMRSSGLHFLLMKSSN